MVDSGRCGVEIISIIGANKKRGPFKKWTFFKLIMDLVRAEILHGGNFGVYKLISIIGAT